MAEVTANRVSALAANYPVGHHGKEGDAGVKLSEGKNLVLCQVAAWPNTFEKFAVQLAQATVSSAAGWSVGEAPGFGQSVSSGSTALLRTEPLKFWVVGTEPTAFDASNAVAVDLPHSQTPVRLQ